MYERAEQVFTEAMPKRFNASEARNHRATYWFVIDKPENPSTWTVTVNDGNLDIQEGDNGEPNCTLRMAEEDYLNMVNGRESIQMLYMTGKLKVEGDLPFAVKLSRFFPADEKK